MLTCTTPGGGGSNEIRLEDKGGAEEIRIQAQYDESITVTNNKTKNVGNNETRTVDGRQHHRRRRQSGRGEDHQERADTQPRQPVHEAWAATRSRQR